METITTVWKNLTEKLASPDLTISEKLKLLIGAILAIPILIVIYPITFLMRGK
jgi:hypothetical protein